METCYGKAERSRRRISMPFYSSHPFLFGFLGFCMLKNLVSSQNYTLIFASDLNNVRNCSCSTLIRDCDYSLANLMCSCKTILFQRNRTLSSLVYTGDLTVWFPNTPTLGQLLNFSLVNDLKISFCGAAPLPAQYLAILGLRHLRVKTRGAPEQSLKLYNHEDIVSKDAACTDSGGRRSSHHISYLDTSLFNRNTSLRSYSVEDVPSIADHFPNLPYPGTGSAAINVSFVVTLIY
ncbi:uncharacterized protein C21orf62 homolog [Spea bombifrons]|uniref:uncharacterized protein C21orf62 homolog n=1 Tax=Spea bombifrons TaxID=233779 RepID=UPI00234A0C24|nr:uncharacterized protein C21orf62 homolog [Spea bombifrons]XP_053312654.1 uncharacterized protein C21orf62 homolog [Spea bombifrons]XP_053312655.1 uncharacterized protein C21orf62 homolog [Spea bombifrons]